MEVRKTKAEELDAVLAIYAYAREAMKRMGNTTQWGDSHPPAELIKADIAAGESYVVLDNGVIRGVFAFIVGEDPTYRYIENGSWLNDEPYGTIHRIASDGKAHGVLREAVRYCGGQTDELRIDTHRDNAVMRHLLEKLGFAECGVIYVGDGTPRLAFQKHTKEAKG